MSSEVLIYGRSITKAFPVDTAGPRLFWRALFGRPNVSSDEIEVLHGIDFDVRRGETVGIMGRNGAGKTTLLSLLSGVAQPTHGTIERNGKVAALLALTAGFHSNLTGRDNSKLFCSLQGLHGASADEKLVGIEQFAEVGDYFDMPLRTYSSGMQARVAFACAVHVNADVIVVDETLAVGDAAFRLKCYDRIRSMRASGQTFLLVSHSPNLIANYCTRGVVLERGRKVFDGSTPEAIGFYKRIRTELLDEETVQTRRVQLKTSETINTPALELQSIDAIVPQDPGIRVRMSATFKALREIDQATINIGLQNHEGIVVCQIDGNRAGVQVPSCSAGEVIAVEISLENRLTTGRYFASLLFSTQVGDVSKPIGLFQNVLQLDVIRSLSPFGGLVDLAMSVAASISPIEPSGVT